MKSSRAGQRTQSKQKSKSLAKSNQGLFSYLTTEAQIVSIVSLVVVVFIVFGNSLQNDFVFDDIYLVVGNQHLRHFNPAFLLQSYGPMRDISYTIDFAIWGEGPFGFHLTNILLHAGNVVLVFFLIRRFTANLGTALIASAIFAVHPLQTDAVT